MGPSRSRWQRAVRPSRPARPISCSTEEKKQLVMGVLGEGQGRRQRGRWGTEVHPPERIAQGFEACRSESPAHRHTHASRRHAFRCTRGHAHEGKRAPMQAQSTFSQLPVLLDYNRTMNRPRSMGGISLVVVKSRSFDLTQAEPTAPTSALSSPIPNARVATTCDQHKSRTRTRMALKAEESEGK